MTKTSLGILKGIIPNVAVTVVVVLQFEKVTLPCQNQVTCSTVITTIYLSVSNIMQTF